MLQYDAVVSFVLFHTAAAEIRDAVDQVLRSDGRYHVVLIDNSEPPLDLQQFASPDVTVITSPGNIGYGAGHNQALRQFAGRTRYHFVLNTDLTFDAAVMPTMVDFMDRHPEAGLAMPVIRYPNGDLQHLCRVLPRPIDVIARAFFSRWEWSKALTRRYEFHSWTYDQPFNFPFLSGCFMALRAEALAQAGLFDERYFMFAEDLDLSRRIHRHYATLLCPDASVTHEYRTQTAKSWRRAVYRMRSLSQYFTKFGWLFDRERAEMNRLALDQVRTGD